VTRIVAINGPRAVAGADSPELVQHIAATPRQDFLDLCGFIDISPELMRAVEAWRPIAGLDFKRLTNEA